MSLNKRYFEMLGAAYEVPDETSRFEGFLGAAMAYFFDGNTDGRLAKDVPRHDADDDALDKHGSRIGALVEAASRREAANTERFHAVLDISVRSGLVSGNAAAAHLTGRTFPCTLDDLPLDPSALAEIRRSMRATKAQAQDRIILTNIETGASRACLALIQRPKDTADQLNVSLSYIDWSAGLMQRLSEAFGLTTSETEILEGYLAGLSQKDIAGQRDRSLETVKGQSKNILRKTGCARMSDVVQLSASIAYLMRQLPEAPDPPSAETWSTPKGGLAVLPRPGGRQLAWYTAGQGPQVVLFVHGYLQGPFFTPKFLDGLAEVGVQLAAPSRPGFGYSSPSRSRADFDQTVVEDALALVDHLGLAKVSLCIHQGGSSHGFRIAGALGDRLGGILVVGGGIPIDEGRHLAHMDPQTRFAAMATRHAPSVMKMVMSVGLPVYRRRGTRAFLEAQFARSPCDLATLADAEVLKVQSEGLYHAVEQGGEAWVRDGASAMADWSGDLDSVTQPQTWLQAAECSIISARDVASRMANLSHVSFQIVEGHGTNLMHTAPALVCGHLARLS
jgi:pimeloyl-ACP methyl ester carboxylesterase/DNA-binding CsgD family transcriptional regulator